MHALLDQQARDGGPQIVERIRGKVHALEQRSPMPRSAAQ